MHSLTKRSAFSLVEMLVVIAIIGIIGAFAVPAVKSMLKGSGLNTGANMLSDEVALARQHALTKSRIVEFRFYRFADPETPGETVASPTSWQFRAFQFFEIADTGDILPAGKFKRLPDGIVMNKGYISAASSYKDTTLSSLLGDELIANAATPARSSCAVLSSKLSAKDPELPRGVKKNYDYVYFRFMPDGTTSLAPNGSGTTATAGGKWFITLHHIADKTETAGLNASQLAPPNFVTWMIDPVGGTSKLLRRGLK
jgi:uncharacterized protein (TIGR02596 family)